MTRGLGAAGRRLGVMFVVVTVAVLAASGTATAAAPGLTPASIATPVMKAGKANGPIPIAGGSHLVQVTHLALSPGNWTVFAKGLFVNTSPVPTTPRPVRCHLGLGAGSDQVLASPITRGEDSSREAFLLTVSAHLAHAGIASVRCSAPGSATGAVVVQWVRMIGFRTAGLSIAPIGNPYQHFGTIGGASQAYQVHSTSRVGLPNSAEAWVGAISLPAGAWAITAKASIQETSTNGAWVNCTLDSSGDLDRTRAVLDPAGLVGDRLPLQLEVVHVFGSAGTAVLTCQSTNAGGTTKIRDITITAYRTSGLLNKNLLVDANFGSFAAGVKPVVDAGFADGPIPMMGDSSFHPIVHMSLPRGSWAVVAKAYLDDSTATGGRLVRCTLGNGSGNDTVELQLPATGTIDTIQPLVLAWSGTFNTPVIVTLTCRTTGPDVVVDWVKMIAYKAGTLQAEAIH